MKRSIERILLLAIVALVAIAAPAYAQQNRGRNSQPATDTASDSFDKISYKGSTGTIKWDTPWRELGESDGPKKGSVGVVSSSYCDGGSCLIIDGGNAGFGGERGVYRKVSFEEQRTGTIRLDYRRVAAGGSGTLLVALSGDGGLRYTTVASISIDRVDASPRALNLSAGDNLTSDTVVRFIGLNFGQSSAVYIDDVLITAVPAPIATTTTTTTTTTLPPGPTTTTSRPPRSTTTTTSLPLPTTTSTTESPPLPTPTTTSLPLPTTTSTTQDPTPTTQAPGPTTTTSTFEPAIGLPGSATTSTSTPTTSSTSTTTTTSTLPPTPSDVQAEGLTGLPEDGGAGSGLTPDELEAFLDKADLVIEINPPNFAESLSEQVVSPVLTPIRGLAAGVTTSVETLQSSSITALLLGLFVAWLGVRGIDRRSSASRPKSRLPA